MSNLSTVKNDKLTGGFHVEHLSEDYKEKCRSNIWKLYLYSFFISFYTVVGILMVFLMKWGNLSFLEVMFLQSYFSIMFFIFEVPAGAFADQIGRKHALIIAAITLAFAGLIYSLVPNIFLFIIAETLWALGEALLSGTTEAFIFSTLRIIGQEEKYSKVRARYESIILIGLLISNPLGIFIAQFISLQFTMTFLFFPYLFAAFIGLLFKEPKFIEKRKTRNFLLNLKSGINKLKKNKVLRILSIDMVIVQAIILVLYWIYQIYLVELNIQMYFFSIIFTLMTLTQVAFLNLVPKFLKWFKKKNKYLKCSTILTGIAVVGLAFTVNVALSVFFVILIAAFGFSRYLIFARGINKQIESENRALVLSSINMIGRLIQAGLYPVIGIVVEINIFLGFFVLGGTIIIITIFSRVRNDYL